MSLPKLTAEQNLDTTQGVYLHKIAPTASNQLGVTTMMESLKELASAKVVGGVCYQVSGCERGRPRKTAFLDLSLTECCNGFPNGSYKKDNVCLECS